MKTCQKVHRTFGHTLPGASPKSEIWRGGGMRQKMVGCEVKLGYREILLIGECPPPYDTPRTLSIGPR